MKISKYMFLLYIELLAEYFKGYNFGHYLFVSLDNFINAFLITFVGVGKIIYKVSKLRGTIGIEKSGNPPATGARSPTDGTGISK